MQINNVEIYGMTDSIRAAKFPMSIDTDSIDPYLTDGIRKLSAAPIGSGHDNWLNGIIVQFDLTASLKFWPQIQRYHFIDFVSSQSIMHKITSFDISTQCNKYVTDVAKTNLKMLVNEYKLDPSLENFLRVVYNVPTGFELTARMTTNYRQLKTIYAQRKTHRLVEWRDFCTWIESLPKSYLITGQGGEE